MKKYTLLALLITLFSLPGLAMSDGLVKEDTLPDDSVYHIESYWRDQHGESFQIGELQGSVRLVAFVYTYCEHTCPVIITKIKSIVETLSEEAKKNIVVTLVSLDPERDTVERVKEYMHIKGLDDQGWQILIGTPDDVLALSALFGVRYKPMGDSDFAHSNVINLVDKVGVIRGQIRGIGQSSDELVKKIEELNQD